MTEKNHKISNSRLMSPRRSYQENSHGMRVARRLRFGAPTYAADLEVLEAQGIL